MSTPWKPSLPVSEALVRSLIAEQCPGLDPMALRYVGAGWDHAVWRCGDTVLRLPHQADSTELACRHVTALRALGKHLPIPIPVPTIVGRPTDEYPATFVGYRWLDGLTTERRQLTVEDRARNAEPLAHVLRILHALPCETGRSWGLELVDNGSMQLRADYGALRAKQLRHGPYASLARLAADAMHPPPPQCPSSDYRVVHGDLHSGQVLFDEAHNISGIIDWDELGIGDPAFDLLMVWSFLPPSARGAFWDLYGDFPGHARARHVALSYGLAILAQAAESSLTALAAEAAFSLENTLA